MVSFDIGPAGDFGSLSAFLGVASTADRLKTKPTVLLETGNDAHGTTSRPKDSTLLNKKVAFRMLKQLGCEVHRLEGENEVVFIEVNLSKQPVLFKMLVELGHAPRKKEDGDMVVRVKEQRQRKPEEVVAALSQPRKPKEVKEEGYPSIGRPRPDATNDFLISKYVCKRCFPKMLYAQT